MINIIFFNVKMESIVSRILVLPQDQKEEELYYNKNGFVDLNAVLQHDLKKHGWIFVILIWFLPSFIVVPLLGLKVLSFWIIVIQELVNFFVFYEGYKFDFSRIFVNLLFAEKVFMLYVYSFIKVFINFIKF